MPEVRTAGTLANRYTLMLMSGSIPTKLIHFAVAHSCLKQQLRLFCGAAFFLAGVPPLAKPDRPIIISASLERVPLERFFSFCDADRETP